MEARMKSPVTILPNAFQALQSLGAAADKAGVPEATLKMVQLRASQINGCSLCIDMHARELKDLGESDERIFAVGAWRDAPYFSDAERTALALTEAVTRLADRDDAVPDALWREVEAQYGERERAALLLAIAVINVWNRLNVPTKQVAGVWRKSAEGQAWMKTQHAAAH